MLRAPSVVVVVVARFVLAASAAAPLASGCSAPAEPHYGPPDGIVGTTPKDPKAGKGSGSSGASDSGAASSGAGPSPCTALEAFTANALEPLRACATDACHAAGAKPFFDLSALGNDDAAACGQARSKIDFTDPESSKLLTKIRPKSGHPLTYTGQASTDYEAALHRWFDNEK